MPWPKVYRYSVRSRAMGHAMAQGVCYIAAPACYIAAAACYSAAPACYIAAPACYIAAPACYIAAPACFIAAPACYIAAPACYIAAPAARMGESKRWIRGFPSGRAWVGVWGPDGTAGGLSGMARAGIWAEVGRAGWESPFWVGQVGPGEYGLGGMGEPEERVLIWYAQRAGYGPSALPCRA
jgi:hypothetical protein